MARFAGAARCEMGGGQLQLQLRAQRAKRNPSQPVPPLSRRPALMSLLAPPTLLSRVHLPVDACTCAADGVAAVSHGHRSDRSARAPSDWAAELSQRTASPASEQSSASASASASASTRSAHHSGISQ